MPRDFFFWQESAGGDAAAEEGKEEESGKAAGRTGSISRPKTAAPPGLLLSCRMREAFR